MRRPARPRGKRADIEHRPEARRGQLVETTRRDWVSMEEIYPGKRNALNQVLAAVADLERRLEDLRERPDAGLPGQRDNIIGLEEELADARLRVLAAKFAAGVDLVAYHLPRREVHYGGAPRAMVATAPAVTVVRTGQMEILYRGADGRLRVRVQDRYQLLVDGEPRQGIQHTRRNVMRQAHMTVAYGVGVGCRRTYRRSSDR